MTVLSRGARVRRGGRRPGWVLLTALLVLAMGASSALVFTNRVELLKLAVILALWAAVAGAFVSVLYRRQSDADQSRVRDLKLVYDLQLDREISARREYELTVESQLRRELASELRAQAADEVAALRAELAALRTSLEILFDTDLDHRRALENSQRRLGPQTARRAHPSTGCPAIGSRLFRRRMRSSAPTNRRSSTCPRWGSRPPALGPPRQPAPPREQVRPPYQAPPPPPRATTATQPESPQWQPPRPTDSGFPPVRRAATGPASTRRSTARPTDGPPAGPAFQPGRTGGGPPGEYGESGRRSRSRHSTEYRDDGVAATPVTETSEAPPPRLAPAPPPEPTPRHRSADAEAEEPEQSEGRRSQSGGQSVADLLARLQVEPTGGGRRRRRDG